MWKITEIEKKIDFTGFLFQLLTICVEIENLWNKTGFEMEKQIFHVPIA